MDKKITLDRMRGLSLDEIINLYQFGYRLEGFDELTENKKNQLSEISENKKNQLTEISENKKISENKQLIDPIVDPVVNFGKVTTSVGYNSSATTINLISGDGSKLPDPSTNGAFNLVWWNSTDYPDPSDDPNREIVRCTDISGDTLTIVRAQEETVASDKNILGKTYVMVLPVTAKTITDLQTDAQTRVNIHGLLTSLTHGVIGNIVGTSDSQSLTNKTITDPTNDVMANLLKSTTTSIDISGSPAPSIGQVLTATSPTSAIWQNLAAPSCFFVTILGSPSSGVFPLAVNFNSTIIGGTGPYTYLWSFGDGGISSSPAPVHNYTANGTFTAGLTVLDSLGNSATSVTTITVLTGVGLVANGLGISESLVVADLMVGFYNASAGQSSPFQESMIMTDGITGIYNLSAGQVSPFQESVDMLDSLTGIYNASLNSASPILEDLTPTESLAFISQISIPTTASVARTLTITVTPTCYLYGSLTNCPNFSWSSSNNSIATVSSMGVVTGVATGTANITASSSGITSNACTVTVT